MANGGCMDRRTPLCPTGHGPFGAAAQKGTLLSEYFCLVHEKVTKIIGLFFWGGGIQGIREGIQITEIVRNDPNFEFLVSGIDGPTEHWGTFGCICSFNSSSIHLFLSPSLHQPPQTPNWPYQALYQLS